MIDLPSASVRGLALRLFAAEKLRPGISTQHKDVAVRVLDKLRVALTRVAGSDGCTSLYRRSLALAQAEVPTLNGVTIQPDCSVDGLETVAAKAAVALAAHLLALLVTFIGEPLTLRLVREGWPDASFDAK